MLQRFGGYEGFDSHLSFLPQRGVGVVVLANGGGSSSFITTLVATSIYNRILNKENWRAEEAQRKAITDPAAGVRARLAKDIAKRRARPQTTALPLEAYAGSYESQVLGRMECSAEDGRLIVRIGLMRGEAEVYNGTLNEWRVAFGGRGSVVAFQVDPGETKPKSLLFWDHAFSRQ
jgi:Domain of unknown function (DUF3471)